MNDIKENKNIIISNIDANYKKFSLNNPKRSLQKYITSNSNRKKIIKNSPKTINIYSEELKIKKDNNLKKNSSSILIKGIYNTVNYSNTKENNFSKKENNKYFITNTNNFKIEGISKRRKKKYFNNNYIKKIDIKNIINLKTTNNDNIFNDNKDSYVYLIKEKKNSLNKKKIKNNLIHISNDNKNNKKSKNKNLFLDKNTIELNYLTCNNFFKTRGRNPEFNIPKQISGFSTISNNNMSSSNALHFINNTKSEIDRHYSFSTLIKNRYNTTEFSNIIKIRKKFNETSKYFYNNQKKKENNILVSGNQSGKNINSKSTINNKSYSNKKNGIHSNKIIKQNKKLNKGNKNKSFLLFNKIIDRLFYINGKNKNKKIYYIKTNSGYNNENININNIIYDKNKKENNIIKMNENNLKYIINSHENNYTKKKELLNNNSKLSLTFKRNKNKSFTIKNLDEIRCFENPFYSIRTQKNYNDYYNETKLMKSNIKNNLLNTKIPEEINKILKKKPTKYMSSRPKNKINKNYFNNKNNQNNSKKEIKLSLISKDEEKKNEKPVNYYISLNNIIKDKNKKFEISRNETLYPKSSEIGKRKEDLIKIIYYTNNLNDNIKQVK